MNVQIDMHKMLLESIVVDRDVKAALVVDPKGAVLEKIGSAMSLRDASENDATATMSATLENVYIKNYGENFVIILFDDKNSFERIKASVDAQVQRILGAS